MIARIKSLGKFAAFHALGFFMGAFYAGFVIGVGL